MSAIHTIPTGFVVGPLARMIHPGKVDQRIFMTSVPGVAGSWLASYGGRSLGICHAGRGAGPIGAVIVLVVSSVPNKKWVGPARGKLTFTKLQSS